MESRNNLYLLLADILDYPKQTLREQVKECAKLIEKYAGEEAFSKMNAFLSFVEDTPLSRLEELYTSTFDLQVVCYPYAGYHIFGESYKRGEFLANLNARYSAIGFSPSNELPDHISVLLRYLTKLQAEDDRHVIISECLIPAVTKMETHLTGGSPYLNVLQSLLIVLNNPITTTLDSRRVA